MSKSGKRQAWEPDWFGPDNIDTIVVAFPDMYGRLMGKRMTRNHFMRTVAESGMDACNYLLTVDIEMNPLPGFKMASWEQGYGDFHAEVDLRTLRPVPWLEGTAIVLCDLVHEGGGPVEESPRRVLGRQLERLAKQNQSAYMGSELECYLFNGNYRAASAKGYRDLEQASDYLIDYNVLQPGRDEDVLRHIRNAMSAAGIEVEGTKGEWGKGQHEINLLYTEAMEMADRHVLFKNGVKEIADLHDRAITFMAKWDAAQAGNSFHLHCSLWDAAGTQSLFSDPDGEGPTDLFRHFLGGMMKYCRELTYFFAPTVNAYKRYQAESWAPTSLVWAHDNRTVGFRVIGHGNGLRIENRTPGADANPYLAFAATLAAGLRGVEEQLDCGEAYTGNAYADTSLPRLPKTLEEAADLLEASELARTAIGDDVVTFYVHTARAEVDAYHNAVTDWERHRYFERL